MKNFLYSLDYLSPSPKIYYLTSPHFSNPFGTTISLLTTLLLLSILSYFLSSFLSFSHPSIYSYHSPLLSSTLLLSKHLRFKLVDNHNNEISPRIAQLIPFLTTSSINTSHHLLNTSKCSITDLLSSSTSSLTSPSNSSNPSFLTNFTCLPNSFISFNNTAHSYITVYVAKCVNSTKNNKYCLPSEDIDVYLIKHRMYLLMYVENIWVNHTRRNAMVNTYSIRKVEVDMSLYYKYYYTFQEVQYESDDGVVFENVNTYTGFLFDRYNDYNANDQNNIGNYRLGKYGTVDMIYPNTLMETVFALNREFRICYVRSYNKLQSVFANAGGFCFIVYLIGKGIVHVFTNGKMFVEIVTIRNKLNAKKDRDKDNVNNNINSSYTNIQNVIDHNESSLSLNTNNKNANANIKHNVSGNHNIVMSLVSYTKYSKEKELAKIKNKLKVKKEKKRNANKKSISYCDSFIYMLFCISKHSTKYSFMRYCELVVKSKLSSDDLIYKLNDLDLLISSHINENNIHSQLTAKSTHVDDNIHEDDKTNLIEIKETSEHSFDNEKQNSIRHITQHNN